MPEVVVRQAILHGAIAAAFVEALLGAWRIRRADSRMAFWLLALAFPLIVLPAFLLFAPFRNADGFGAQWALLCSRRWDTVRIAGIGVDRLAITLLALAGVVLFLRDVVPFVVDLVRERHEEASADVRPPDSLVEIVADLARRARLPLPRVMLLTMDAPVLFARGLRRPALVLSTGVLGRLPNPELRAAISHELAHLRFRDPFTGWLLMLARVVMFWNPAVQLVCRAIAQEMERRADRFAVVLTDAAPFASAVRVLDGPPPDPVSKGLRASIALLSERLRHAHIAARLAALAEPNRRPQLVRTRLALAGTALAVMLFFVV